MGSGMVRVEGGRQLRATMKKAAVDVNELKDVHRVVSSLVSAAGQPNTPRGTTGKLAGSVRPGATRTAAIVRAGGARVPYANAIHWGWRKRNIKSQPWLSDAARAAEPTWFAMYVEEIEKILGTIKGI